MLHASSFNRTYLSYFDTKNRENCKKQVFSSPMEKIDQKFRKIDQKLKKRSKINSSYFVERIVGIVSKKQRVKLDGNQTNASRKLS